MLLLTEPMRATVMYGAHDVRIDDVPFGRKYFMRNVTLTGGVAPARAYIEESMPDVLEGVVEPGRVFDRTIGIEEIPDGYRAMADRVALKVLIRP
jgi:threonine dehydrogenase-like Zn-dependent dehydrogenase